MKLMDKLINKVKFDKKYVFYTLIIILIGILTGSLFIVILNNSDKSLVGEYITSFINNYKTGNIYFLDLFKNTILNNTFFILILWIIGLTYFLFPINILILFYKSFVIGFSISSFIMLLGLKGILVSIIYIFPHQVLNILIFSLLTAYSLKYSIKMIKSIINKEKVDISLNIKKYVCLLILILLIILMTSLYESYILPRILKFIFNIFLQ